jgi:hypothetical protein
LRSVVTIAHTHQAIARARQAADQLHALASDMHGAVLQFRL